MINRGCRIGEEEEVMVKDICDEGKRFSKKNDWKRKGWRLIGNGYKNWYKDYRKEKKGYKKRNLR